MSNEGISRRDFLKTTASGAVAMTGLGNLAENTETASQTENKFINKEGNCEFTFTSPDPGKAHESANTFAREIGNALKAAYPSKILAPKVSLKVFTRNGQKLYSLTWTAKIVKTTPAEANWYFDRRGTLLWGKTLAEAKQKVEAELKTSDKVPSMRRALKNGNIPQSFIQDSFSGSSTEGFWYIKEFFMVAPK